MAKRQIPPPIPLPLIITTQLVLAFSDAFAKAAGSVTDPNAFKNRVLQKVWTRLILRSVQRNIGRIVSVDEIVAQATSHGKVARRVCELKGLPELDFETLFDTLDDIKQNCPVITIKDNVRLFGLACDF